MIILEVEAIRHLIFKIMGGRAKNTLPPKRTSVTMTSHKKKKTGNGGKGIWVKSGRTARDAY